MRGDDRVDMISHEKGPQRSLIRNKPTETLANGSSVVKQQYCTFAMVIHKQKDLEVSTKLKHSWLAACSVERKLGRERK